MIYEKSSQLGGTFIAASAESYKGKLRELLTWYRRQMEQLDIEIHLNTEVGDLSQFAGAGYRHCHWFCCAGAESCARP